MKDSWLIFNAEGKMVARGEGRMPNLQPGEYFDWYDNNELLNNSIYVQDDNEKEIAREELHNANQERDKQAYIDKAACAKAFLKRVKDGKKKGDVSVIPDDCKELKAEYEATHDLIDMTPWELARAIVKKSDTSEREAKRRRRKLLALQTLAKPPPEPPRE